MNWTQTFVGRWGTSKVLDDYGVRGIPETFLLDPQGTILRIGLRGDQMYQAVQAVLESKK